MAARIPTPVLVIGGGILLATVAALLAGGGDAQAGTTVQPLLEGGTVVSAGRRSNAAGVTVEFQIEELDGQYFGIIMEPWNNNRPTAVAQTGDLDEAREKLFAHIDADTHGGL